jgi:hypothetical protein
MGIVNTIGGLLYCISIPPCVPLYEVGKRFGGFLGLREKVFLEKKNLADVSFMHTYMLYDDITYYYLRLLNFIFIESFCSFCSE